MRLTAHNQSQNTLLEAVRIGGALVGLVLLSACSVNGTSQASHIVPVDAARVGQKMLPLEVSATGNAIAYSSIEIRPEIDGQLTWIHFKEGQDVKKGHLLFTIDSPILQATLQEARANLSKNLAVVDQGLAAGDLVVAEAPLDLIPGTRVTVRETGFSGPE